MSAIDPSVVEVWLASRAVIVEFLRELRPDMSEAHLLHNAAAVLARLANHDPPLLVGYAHNWKGADE